MVKNTSSEHFNVIFKLCVSLHKEMLTLETEPIRQEAAEKAQRERGKQIEESGGGRGKIRYIAGWCLSGMKKKKKSMITNNMYNKKKVSMMEQMILEKEIIEHLESTESELLRFSTDQESLKETARRQNVRKFLTNVNDQCFKYFLSLDEKIRELETEQNLNLYGSNFYQFLTTEIKSNVSLCDSWENLFRVI